MSARNIGLLTALLALIVAGACGRGAPAAGKVLIVSDGSVNLALTDSDLVNANPSSGRKYRWSDRAQSVRIYDCDGSPQDTKSFNLVEVNVGGGHPEVTLHFKNEGGRLVVAFGGPYDIKGQGTSRRLEHDEEGPEALGIQRVRVNGQEQKKPGERTCVRFDD